MVYEVLTHRHEDLNSVPQHPYQKLGTMMHTCNPRTGEAETGAGGMLGVHWSASLAQLVSFKFNKGSYAKKEDGV